MNKIRKYGVDWPEGSNELSVELACYRMYIEPDFPRLHPRSYHMINAMRLLWPEDFGNQKRGFVMSPWTHRRVRAWCEPTFIDGDEDYQSWWGPSTTGKSTDAAAIAMTDWLSAPDKTTVNICSTTRPMLERRIWREILRFYNYLKGKIPAQYFRSRMGILYDDGTQSFEDTASGIFGIAIFKGSIEEAIGNIVGVHNDRNILIIDECQAMRMAAIEAYDNLSTGLESKFLAMGNPVSRIDPLGKVSEPEAGWESISMADDDWQTKKGKCIFFNGLESPGVHDPKRYPFLLNKKQIDSMRIHPGENSPSFWSQRIGFIPPQGLIQTVMSEPYIVQFGLNNDPTWVGDYTVIAGLDESFTSGGDRSVLQIAKIGRVKNGQMAIAFEKPILFALEMSEDVSVEYNLAHQVRDVCKHHGIPIKNLGIDVSAQQAAMASIIEQEWEKGIYRVKFGGSATDLPVSANDPRPANEVYKNRVTELWYNVREFGAYGQIYNLPEEAASEFCNRLVLDNSIVMFVESKRDMKLRTGQSPDYADAVAIVCAVVREVLGIHPGDTTKTSDYERDQRYRDLDLDGRDDNYLHSSLEDNPHIQQAMDPYDWRRRRHEFYGKALEQPPDIFDDTGLLNL